MDPAFPDFLIIGAARAGTTTLYHQLREHPQIFLPVTKELNFFSMHWDKGWSWYTNHFKERAEGLVSGEASTTYTRPDFPLVPLRISESLPEVKLIYVMRNPVMRTFSHYLYYKQHQKESAPFAEALETNPLYLSMSDYLFWIETYLQFFDKQSFHFIVAEDFFKNPQAELKALFRFLNVNEHFIPQSIHQKTNVAGQIKYHLIFSALRQISRRARTPIERFLPEKVKIRIRNQVHQLVADKEKPRLSPAAKEDLISRFSKDIDSLETLTGKNLTIWREQWLGEDVPAS